MADLVLAQIPDADFQYDYRSGLVTTNAETRIARIVVPANKYRRVIYHNAGPEGAGGFTFDGYLLCKAGGRQTLRVPFSSTNAAVFPIPKPIFLLGTAGAIGSATQTSGPNLQIAGALNGNLLESGGIPIDIACDEIELVGQLTLTGTTGHAVVACLSTLPI